MNIEQEKMIVESLPSLYPMQKFEEEAIKEILDALPLAKPQIIRCKDCKNRDNYGCCKHWKGLAMGDIPIATDDNDFCSYAKRKNDVFNER